MACGVCSYCRSLTVTFARTALVCIGSKARVQHSVDSRNLGVCSSGRELAASEGIQLLTSRF